VDRAASLFVPDLPDRGEMGSARRTELFSNRESAVRVSGIRYGWSSNRYAACQERGSSRMPIHIPNASASRHFQRTRNRSALELCPLTDRSVPWLTSTASDIDNLLLSDATVLRSTVLAPGPLDDPHLSRVREPRISKEYLR
jgi:hypothetical protein